MNTERKVEDYLHLYIGAKIERWFGGEQILSTLDPGNLAGFILGWDSRWHKLRLRPLSSMKVEEMRGLIKILISDAEDKIDDDELQDIEMFYWDNSTMVDGDIQVGANFDCRCFEGQLAIRECGSIFLWDAYGKELQPLTNIPEANRYLQSLGFDLYRLIPSGLAIDSTTLKTQQ